MRDIASLRQLRAKAYQELTDIQAKATGESRAMTSEEQAAFDTKAGEVEAFDAEIRNAQKLEQLKASTAISSPLSEHDAPDAGPAPAPSTLHTRVEPQAASGDRRGIFFSQIVRSLVVGRGDVEAAHKFASNTWGEGYEVTAALQANDASSGGFLVPERYSQEIIELLRPRTVVRKHAQVVPLVGGSDTYPTVESGTAAYYIGEGQDIQTSEPSFGNIKFIEREIAALVPISNKLLRNASPNVDQMVRDDLVNAFAQAEDLAFIRSQGIGPAPKGIRYAVASANIIAANGTVNLANVDADARKLINALSLYDIPMRNVWWLMSPRVYGYLQDLRDPTTGVPTFPSLQGPTPTWKGFPVEQTNNIPVNLGSGSDSELYLVDFAEAVIADTYQVRIDTSESASYKVGSSLVSAYSRNQTLIRAVAAHDFGLRRSRAAAVLTGVTWGS